MSGVPDPMDAAFLGYIPPQPSQRKRYDVETPEPGETIELVVLSHRPVITATHYKDQHSYACVGTKNGCAWCLHNVHPRIKGYVACYNYKKGRKVLAELTRNCLDTHPLLVQGGPSLRGKKLFLFRPGEAKNGRVVCRFEENYSRTQLVNLPEAFNVVSACKAMWRLPTHDINPETGEAVPLDHSAYFPAALNPDLQEPAQGDDEEPDLPAGTGG